jgi:hypothetical protein
MTTLGIRLRTSLLVAFTKIFLGGCMWQIMGLLSDEVFKFGGGQHRVPPFFTTVSFSVLTGIGDAVGVFIGHSCLSLIDVQCLNRKFHGWSNFFQISGILSFGSILSGGSWQGLTDGCINNGLHFNLAILLVGLGCGLFFFVGITTGRAVFQLPRATFKDFTLSLACGCGSGVFVGTDRRYPENWLQGLVGERTGNSSLDVFKAGLSVFLGFLVAQIVLSLFLRQGYSWTDEDETREDVCNVSDNNGHVDPLLGIE